MSSRLLAAISAASLLVATAPATAQERTPTSGIPTARQNQNSDLLLILGAIAGAALLTFLAMNIEGDDAPASP